MKGLASPQEAEQVLQACWKQLAKEANANALARITRLRCLWNVRLATEEQIGTLCEVTAAVASQLPAAAAVGIAEETCSVLLAVLLVVDELYERRASPLLRLDLIRSVFQAILGTLQILPSRASGDTSASGAVDPIAVALLVGIYAWPASTTEAPKNGNATLIAMRQLLAANLRRLWKWSAADPETHNLLLVSDSCLEMLRTVLQQECTAGQLWSAAVKASQHASSEDWDALLLHLLSCNSSGKNYQDQWTAADFVRIEAWLRAQRLFRSDVQFVASTSSFLLIEAYLERFLEQPYFEPISESAFQLAGEYPAPSLALQTFYILLYNDLVISRILPRTDRQRPRRNVLPYTERVLGAVPHAFVLQYIQQHQTSLLPRFIRLFTTHRTQVDLFSTYNHNAHATVATLLASLDQSKYSESLKQAVKWKLFSTQFPLQALQSTLPIFLTSPDGNSASRDSLFFDPVELLFRSKAEVFASQEYVLELFLDLLQLSLDKVRNDLETKVSTANWKNTGKFLRQVSDLERATMIAETAVIQQLLVALQGRHGTEFICVCVGKFLQNRLTQDRRLLRALCIQGFPWSWYPALVQHTPDLEAAVNILPEILASPLGHLQKLNAAMLALHLSLRYRTSAIHAIVRDLVRPLLGRLKNSLLADAGRRYDRDVDVEVLTSADLAGFHAPLQEFDRLYGTTNAVTL